MQLGPPHFWQRPAASLKPGWQAAQAPWALQCVQPLARGCLQARHLPAGLRYTSWSTSADQSTSERRVAHLVQLPLAVHSRHRGGHLTQRLPTLEQPGSQTISPLGKKEVQASSTCSFRAAGDRAQACAGGQAAGQAACGGGRGGGGGGGGSAVDQCARGVVKLTRASAQHGKRDGRGSAIGASSRPRPMGAHSQPLTCSCAYTANRREAQ